MGGVDGPVYATIIPVLNERNHIEMCLRSLLQQSIDPSLHIIMVLDGGSTDGTQDVVRDLQRDFSSEESPQLVLLDNPGRTVSHGRNEAMKHLPSTVKYLIEMIGHASVKPTHLEERIQAWTACESLSTKPLGGVGVKVCSPTTSM
ncbi:MAG: glycosyltransferase, partial [Candidatus Poseidonia sp.]|nr:glycosyltransferase [Poseidonia sp.]